MMKVKYIAENDPLSLLNGKIYDARILKKGWYGIVDETNEEHTYPPELFEIIEESEEELKSNINQFSYNILKFADRIEFERICAFIESKVENIKKDNLLEDVDGSQIQIFNTPNGRIKVFNDYEVDAVYVDSEMNLNSLISLYKH